MNAPAGLTLVIANKNYSSWSMRPWVLLRGYGIAIAERLHERRPGSGVWPDDAQLRARARSLCTEIHGGFRAL